MAGAFNTNILKMAMKFIGSKTDQNIDVVCIGRKGRDFMRRRYPVAPPIEPDAEVALPPVLARIQIVGEHVGVLGKLEYSNLPTR